MMPARLEVRVEAPTEPPAPRLSWRLQALLALSIVMGVAQPRSIGLPMLLPALFVWLGLWLARRAAVPAPPPLGSTIRFFDDRLDIEQKHSLGRTPWEHVEKVFEREPAVVIRLRSSAEVVIPDEAVPGGRDALVAALPAALRIEEAPAASAQPVLDRRIVVGLVVVLAYGLWWWLER